MTAADSGYFQDAANLGGSSRHVPLHLTRYASTGAQFQIAADVPHYDRFSDAESMRHEGPSA